MQAVINHKLIRKRARTGKIATAIGFAALGVGFITSWNMSSTGGQIDTTAVTITYAVLSVALVAIGIGRYHMARWVRRPRADDVLVANLRELDNRYYLLSYLPGVGTDHLLITPSGLTVIVAKHLSGDIRNRGNRWQRKLGIGMLFGAYIDGNLGNPTNEAYQGMAAVATRVSKELPNDAESVLLSSVIVFTEPRSSVQVEEPKVPVVKPADLAAHIRGLQQQQAKGKMAPERLQRLLNLLAPDRAQYEEAPTTGKESKKKSIRKARRRTQEPLTDMRKMGRNRAERRMK